MFSSTHMKTKMNRFLNLTVLFKKNGFILQSNLSLPLILDKIENHTSLASVFYCLPQNFAKFIRETIYKNKLVKFRLKRASVTTQ